LLFIVIHQSYELWFKVMIDELERATTALVENAPWRATNHLHRMVRIEDMLLEHLRVLETMSPEGFLEFRDPLDPASGFQSFQFRAVEFLSGGGRKGMLNFELFSEKVKIWLKSKYEQTNIWAAYESSLANTIPEGETLEKLVALYHDHASAERHALHQVAEQLMDHDERLAMWRHQHMLMAGRQIGRRPGTGGSEGMAYLDTTIGQRLYPLLWEVRSAL
jgi:tryptophan 2,3-dioxygenase